MILSIQSSGDVAYGTTPSVKFRLTVENKSDTGDWKKIISCNRNLTHSGYWRLEAPPLTSIKDMSELNYTKIEVPCG